MASRRLTTVLMVVLALALFAGAFYPQSIVIGEHSYAAWEAERGELAELGGRLGLHRIFQGWAFKLFTFLLAGLISWCLVKNSRRWWAGGVRQRLALLFHIGLLGLMLGGGVSWSSGYQGEILLTEGQAKRENETGFLRLQRRVYLNRLSGDRLGLISFKPEAREVGGKRVPEALIVVESGGNSRTGRLYINHPWRFSGRTYYYSRYGYAPVLRVVDDRGSEVLRSCFSLNYQQGSSRSSENYPRLASGTGSILDGPARIEYTAVPGVSSQAGQAELIIDFSKFAGGTISLAQGECYEYQGLSYCFSELRYWAYLRVVRDPGYLLVAFFATFCILVVCLMAVFN